VREQRVVLEHEPDAPALGRDEKTIPDDRSSGELDRPALRALEPRYQSQERGLPAAARPEQCQDLAGLHGDRDVVDRDRRPEAFGQADAANRGIERRHGP
jgi:hypothetical protein